MRHLTLVLAYYENPGMLARQYETWAAYPQDIKRRVQVIVVDDGSPTRPAIDVPRPEGLPRLGIYRITVDRPWNQDAARNLGAHMAPDGWLFLTDMDHLLPADQAAQLLRRVSDPGLFYTFARMDAGTGRPMLDGRGVPKPHPNSYAMTRELYWRAGGYDEDFCGVYGTDGAFRKQLLRVGVHRHLQNVAITRVPRTLVPDANTTTLDRASFGGPARKAAAWERKRAAGREHEIVVLQSPWERQL